MRDRVHIVTFTDDAPFSIDYDVPLEVWMKKLVSILKDYRVIGKDEEYSEDERIIIKKRGSKH